MNSSDYTLTDQLEELRKRIFIVLLFLAAGATGIFVFINPVVDRLIETGPDVPVVYISPPEIFLMKIKITLIAAMLITLPVTALQICLFIFPSLYRREKIRTTLFIIMMLLCAGGGAFFAFRGVVPSILHFLSRFSHPSIQPMFDLKQYVEFITGIIFFFALLFQTPAVFFFLGSMGIVTADMLRSVRKYMYLVLLLVSALITPADLVSMLILALPLFLLYETGILLVALAGLRKGTK